MRPRPQRLERLPQQYFAALLERVRAAAAEEGDPLVDLGRGNPDIAPPPHVAERLAEASASSDPIVHGYPPFRGVPALREALAARYRDVYGVEVDPDREIAVLPGSKTGIVELALVLAERGSTIVLPDPGYPDYFSGVSLAAARLGSVPLDSERGWAPDFSAAPRDDVAAVYLNYPSNPCAVCAPEGAFEGAIEFAHETGAAIVHDFAYGDLVFDGREPESFLAVDGAREVGVELFSMSKSYGMAGWRIGFVVGNEEIVARINLLADHTRASVFVPLQEAAAAALTGPQDTVAERVSVYQRRRDTVVSALGERIVCEGTFYVWLELPEGLTAERLLAEHRVAVAPGEGFGPSGAGWIRLSLAVPDAQLELGLGRLAAAFAA